MFLNFPGEGDWGWVGSPYPVSPPKFKRGEGRALLPSTTEGARLTTWRCDSGGVELRQPKHNSVGAGPRHLAHMPQAEGASPPGAHGAFRKGKEPHRPVCTQHAVGGRSLAARCTRRKLRGKEPCHPACAPHQRGRASTPGANSAQCGRGGGGPHHAGVHHSTAERAGPCHPACKCGATGEVGGASPPGTRKGPCRSE